MNNDQKTALITGASSGIGKALAENFARDGYAVILAARSENKLEILAEDLHRRFGVTAIAATADLESASGADGLYAYVKGRGMRLSALVNNAGFGVFGEFTDAALGPQLSMMRLNMNAVVALTKLFLPDLLSTKGKVLNVASTGAFQPGPYFAVYAATKAFVLSFSEAIAAELAGTGVTVTALCPGPTATGFSDREDMHKSRLFKGKKLPNPEQVAVAGYRAMKRGKRVYVHGLMNRVMAFSVRFTPRAIVIEVVKFLSKPA